MPLALLEKDNVCVCSYSGLVVQHVCLGNLKKSSSCITVVSEIPEAIDPASLCFLLEMSV